MRTYVEVTLYIEHHVTPQEKAEWEYKTQVGIAAEIAKLKFPEQMIFGGGSGSPTNPFDALGLEAYRKMITTPKK